MNQARKLWTKVLKSPWKAVGERALWFIISPKPFGDTVSSRLERECPPPRPTFSRTVFGFKHIDILSKISPAFPNRGNVVLAVLSCSSMTDPDIDEARYAPPVAVCSLS